MSCLTFACRRTRIYNPDEITKILHDDEYIEIQLQNVKPGDIVVYYDNDGEAIHSGIIYSTQSGLLNIPMVMSKWGGGHEYLHSLNNSGIYNNSIKKFYRVNYGC